MRFRRESNSVVSDEEQFSRRKRSAAVTTHPCRAYRFCMIVLMTVNLIVLCYYLLVAQETTEIQLSGNEQELHQQELKKTDMNVMMPWEYIAWAHNSTNLTRKTINLRFLHSQMESVQGSFKVYEKSPLASSCSVSFLSVFTNAIITKCAAIVTSNRIFSWSDFSCKMPCSNKCMHVYNEHFNINTLPHQVDLKTLYYEGQTLSYNHTKVIKVTELIPLLFIWGAEFPHIVKDVLPRLQLSFDYFQSNPSSHLLMYRSNTVLKFLQHLEIPLERVIFMDNQLPNPASLYGDSPEYMYHAKRIVLPQCAPGPPFTGLYAPEIYHQLRDRIVGNKPIELQHRQTIIYISRKGGSNVNARQIENERELLEGLVSKLSLVYQNSSMPRVIRFVGSDLSLQEAVDLFKSARVVFGPHGGGFYNIISCAPGTKVIELSPDDYGKAEVAKFSAKMKLDHQGFIKQKMSRTESFGTIPLDWFISVITNAYDNQLFPQTLPLPIEFSVAKSFSS